VKGDAEALTYDDALYKRDIGGKPIRVAVSKAEADARFPLRPKRVDESDEIEDRPLPPRPPPPRPNVLDETEAEEDARLLREKQEAQERVAQRRALAEERIASRRALFLDEDEDKVETREERAKRWRWEALEDIRKPWRTMTNQKRKLWDDRVLYDPVTMQKFISYTPDGIP
jgi:hypothetical protein